MLAAARFWSWRRTDLLCLPALGRQLPFSPAAFPRCGSNPGQQCCDEAGFFAVLLLVCRAGSLERAANVIERSDAIERHERSPFAASPSAGLLGRKKRVPEFHPVTSERTAHSQILVSVRKKRFRKRPSNSPMPRS